MRSGSRAEGTNAMRLLTRDDTDFQPRLIAAFEGLLKEETAAGRLDLPVDLPRGGLHHAVALKHKAEPHERR
jgi:hypothetical protein